MQSNRKTVKSKRFKDAKKIEYAWILGSHQTLNAMNFAPTKPSKYFFWQLNGIQLIVYFYCSMKFAREEKENFLLNSRLGPLAPLSLIFQDGKEELENALLEWQVVDRRANLQFRLPSYMFGSLLKGKKGGLSMGYACI